MRDAVRRVLMLSLAVVLIAACSEDTSDTRENDSFEPSDAEAWAVEFGESLEAGDFDDTADLFSPSWVSLGIPMTEGDHGVGPPDALAGALEFIAAWMTLDVRDCVGESAGGGVVTVRCTADVSGPFPAALDSPQFDLPVVFNATSEGLVSFGTDYATVEDPSYIHSPETDAYVQNLTGFLLFSQADAEFSAQYTEGIGRPVINLESAAAHIALAQEWLEAGKP